MYGPKGLGKLSAGGHPRRLAQQGQSQHGQDSILQNESQDEPNRQPQAQQQQHGSPDQTQTPEQVAVQDQNSQRQVSKDQLSQTQLSQEQHSQQQVHEQFSEGAKGTAAEGTQAVPIRKADCFAAFNPPTVEEYQEVWRAAPPFAIIEWLVTVVPMANYTTPNAICACAAFAIIASVIQDQK